MKDCYSLRIQYYITCQSLCWKLRLQGQRVAEKHASNELRVYNNQRNGKKNYKRIILSLWVSILFENVPTHS